MFLHLPIFGFSPLLKKKLRNVFLSSESRFENRGELHPAGLNRFCLPATSDLARSSLTLRRFRPPQAGAAVFCMWCLQNVLLSGENCRTEQKHIRTAGNGRATAAALTSSQGHVCKHKSLTPSRPPGQLVFCPFLLIERLIYSPMQWHNRKPN